MLGPCANWPPSRSRTGQPSEHPTRPGAASTVAHRPGPHPVTGWCALIAYVLLVSVVAGLGLGHHNAPWRNDR